MSTETASTVSDLLVDGAMVAWVIALVGFAVGSAARASRAVPAVPAGVGAVEAGALGDVARGGDLTDEPPAPEPANPRERWLGIGWSTFVLGAALLAGAVIARGLAVGRAPWGNMYEFSLVGIALLALLVLWLRRRYDIVPLMPWVTGVGLMGLGIAQLSLYVPAGPLVPALDSPWLVIHVAAAIIATAIFTVSMVASALFLVADRRESSAASVETATVETVTVETAAGGSSTDGAAGPATSTARRSRLPRASTLETLSYRMVTVAFPIWSFAVVAGAIWAEYAWGRYWGWDPKETWSLITWIVYAAFLHARTTAGWRGRRAAVISLVGYATLMFNFFGVNIFLPGLHSYGGV